MLIEIIKTIALLAVIVAAVITLMAVLSRVNDNKEPEHDEHEGDGI